MATVLHKDLLSTENHKIQYWTWASDAARAAQSVAPSDIGKVGYQTDTMQFYILTNWSPATWSPLSGYTAASPVRAQYAASTAQTCANATPINFDTKVVDTDNAVTAAAAGVTGTWKFTCPPGKGGTYQINGSLVFNGAHTVNLAKNGVLVRNLCTANQNSYGVSFSTTIDLNPGDFISLWGTGGLATIAGVANNHIEITRVPDSGVASGATVPTVYVQAGRVAGQTAGASDTLIQYDTAYLDSTGAFTTGASARFTCKVAGVYSVKAILNLATVGTGMSINIYKNGTLQIGDGATQWMASVSGDVVMVPGDYIDIRARSWSGTSPSFTSNLQITRYADQAVAPSIAGFSPVRADAVQTVGQSVAAGGVVNFDSKTLDSDAAVTTGAAWRFTCPAGKGGVYQVVTAVTTNSSGAASALQLFKNGVLAKVLGTAQYNTAVVTALISLSPGDYIDVRCQAAITTYSAVAGFNWIQVSSLSTYAIPDQAKPIAKYRCVAAWSATTGVFTIVPYDTKLFDSHSAFTTGAAAKYTCPLAGKYRVTATAASASGFQTGLYIFKNGVQDSMATYNLNNSYVHGSAIVDCAAGDYLDTRLFVSGGTRVSDAAPTQNWITIEYLGP